MTKANYWNGDERIIAPHSQTVFEQEKPAPAVVYDHEGNALMRKRQPMGFDLSRGDE